MRVTTAFAPTSFEMRYMLQAAEHWTLAPNVNSLCPEGCFALGYCYLKLDERQKSLQAFTRATQQQPDHGDAWNNIAALCLKVKKRAP